MAALYFDLADGLTMHCESASEGCYLGCSHAIECLVLNTASCLVKYVCTYPVCFKFRASDRIRIQETMAGHGCVSTKPPRIERAATRV